MADIMDDVPPPSPVVQVASLPAVTKWSLHTLGGKPVMKLEVKGERHYKAGEVVSDEDLDWTESPIVRVTQSRSHHRFRGTVTKAHVAFAGGQVSQSLEVELHHHEMIASGEYRPRTVVRSQAAQPAVPAAKPAVASKPSVPAAKPKIRFIDLSEEQP